MGNRGVSSPEVTLAGRSQCWERGAVPPQDSGWGWGLSGPDTCGRRRAREDSSKRQRGLQAGGRQGRGGESVVCPQGLTGGRELSSGRSSGRGFVLLLVVNYYRLRFLELYYSFVSGFFGLT